MSVRTRSLSDLTWPEVRQAVERGAGVVLPVGSTEQHSYHLPLSTDVILPTELAHEVAGPLDLLVAPGVSYGYRSRPLSGGGQGFVGTVSLSAHALMALVEDVVFELIRHGFHRIVLLNWHYENMNFIYEAATLAHDRGGSAAAQIMVVEAPFAELSEGVMRQVFGDEFPGWNREHAAILETSLMLLLRPDLVLFDRAVDDESKRHPFYDVVPPPDDFIPVSGALWKATQASAEKGRSAWGEICANLEEAIRQEFSGKGQR